MPEVAQTLGAGKKDCTFNQVVSLGIGHVDMSRIERERERERERGRGRERERREREERERERETQKREREEKNYLISEFDNDCLHSTGLRHSIGKPIYDETPIRPLSFKEVLLSQFHCLEQNFNNSTDVSCILSEVLRHEQIRERACHHLQSLQISYYILPSIMQTKYAALGAGTERGKQLQPVIIG